MKQAKTFFDQNSNENIYLSILNNVSQIISYSDDFATTLNKIVNLIATKLYVDVCSIYIYHPKEKVLVLQATKGLNPLSTGKIQLNMDQGVTSLVIQEMKPISISNVQEHPRFLLFPEAEEVDFNSFLGVPIMDNKNPIGVFVVQKKENYEFHINEINMLQVLASQIASVIQVARVFEKSTTQDDNQTQETMLSIPPDQASQQKEFKKLVTLQGLSTSFGYGFGKVLILNERYNYSVITDYKVTDTQQELNRFKIAIEKSMDEIKSIKSDLEKQIDSNILKIFDSHILILKDAVMIKKIEAYIKDGYNCAYATLQVIDHYIDTFSQFNDSFIKEKVVDIEDIGRRIITNILGLSHLNLKDIPEKSIIIAKFLTPSTTANLDTSKVAGIVTEHGGRTSHASILARSLEIPAVVGVVNLLNKVNITDNLLVDGNTGFVFVNPPKSLIYEYERKAQLEIRDYHNFFLNELQNPLLTQDGYPVEIKSNIGILQDIEIAKNNGAKGVGLFRTEFLYMTHDKLPTVDEQYEVYKRVVESFPEGEVVIRTLDIGGDKLLPYLPFAKEENPCLGHKSSRFLLDHPKILFDQLKAILKASPYGRIKILFPMISSLDEFIKLRDFIEIAKGTLTYNNIPFNEEIEVGMMIEVPSVVFQIEDFIPEVDFFSIGTNDLIQYLLAVDRDNEKVSNIYNPLHPAVLRTIDLIYRKISKVNKSLTVCGEMAGSAQSSLALLALGISKLSSIPTSIPYLHYLVRKVNQDILNEIRDKILTLKNVQEIEIYITKKLKSIAPMLYNN